MIKKEDLENNITYWKEKYENLKYHYESEENAVDWDKVAAAIRKRFGQKRGFNPTDDTRYIDTTIEGLIHFLKKYFKSSLQPKAVDYEIPDKEYDWLQQPKDEQQEPVSGEDLKKDLKDLFDNHTLPNKTRDLIFKIYNEL